MKIFSFFWLPAKNYDLNGKIIPDIIAKRSFYSAYQQGLDMANHAKIDWFFTILLCSSLLGFLLFAVLSFLASGYKSAALKAGIAKCHLNIQSIEESFALADSKKKKEMLGANGELNIKAFDLPENLTFCPMSGFYKIENVRGEEICLCTFHGDRNGKIPGKIDPDHSIFYWIFAWIKEATNS